MRCSRINAATAQMLKDVIVDKVGGKLVWYYITSPNLIVIPPEVEELGCLEFAKNNLPRVLPSFGLI